MTALYVPPTEESDHKKQNMSLQLIGSKTTDNTTNIATNTASIVTNTTAISALQAGPLVAGAVAAQSDQETSTSTTLAVTPGRQQFHPSAAKAWVKWTGSTGGILASYNVASVTRSSAGVYVVNFTTSFSSANYGVAASCEGTGGAVGLFAVVTNASPATGSCGITTISTTFAAADPAKGYAAFYGDQ